MNKIFLIIIAAAMMVVIISCGKENTDSQEKDSLSEYIDALNIDLSADIMIYGEEQDFDERLNVRRIDTLNENVTSEVKNYGYQAIIIVDRNGTLKLTDEDFEFIERYTVSMNRDIIYLGSQYLPKLTSIFKNMLTEEDYGLGIYGCFPDDLSVIGVGACNGIWTKSDEEDYNNGNTESLSSTIVTELYFNATGESYK